MRKWRVVLLCVCMLVACAYVPGQHKRTSQERVEEGIRDFDRGSRIIKGKNAPEKLF